MNNKIILLPLVSVFLLSAMVVASSAQPRIVGVNEGDWFKYGDITANWSSNDPSYTPAESLKAWNETEYLLMSVVEVLDTYIGYQSVWRFRNGTERIDGHCTYIDTGSGNTTMFFISAYLSTNDTIYTSGSYSNWRINETVVRTYPDGSRETNHVNVTSEVYDGTDTKNIWWDRTTGALVEMSIEVREYSGEYLATESLFFTITDSDVWIIPEFPSFLILPLFMIATLLAVIVYKRKQTG